MDKNFEILKLNLKNNLYEFTISKLIDILKDVTSDIGSEVKKEQILKNLEKEIDWLTKKYDKRKKTLKNFVHKLRFFYL